MAISPTFAKIACVVVVAMVVAAPAAEALSCGTVSSSLAQCIAYARSSGGTVPTACCNGIRTLNSLAKTSQDRKDACACLKSAAGRISGLNLSLIAGLPGKCGVNIPYKISPSTDCSKYDYSLLF
ncbi:hypothetical protein TIFTF001_009786 [Ficus carica]|uniref:Non-specific lipid-transfer protein n=1 Tax=Ficus carica TaxID=3494 RepID=A0AA87ZVW7_FICCA|nr:hypothetical protein TIFTF001_009786 [Ficus carica]